MIKKPLVLNNGEVEQLQPGDSLAPVPNSLVLGNSGVTPISICTPVYISGEDTADVAHKGMLPDVVGIATEEIGISPDTGIVQTDGKLTATTEAWDNRTGQNGGLTAGAAYYLGDWGAVIIDPPTTQGEYLVRLGIAINSTDFEIKISRPIRL